MSVQRDALRTITAVALQVSAKEELVSEGALPLLLGLLEATLNIPPSALTCVPFNSHGWCRLVGSALAHLPIYRKATFVSKPQSCSTALPCGS